MLTAQLTRNIHLGLASLGAHKLRSALTTLGIIFGVASVICMLAIGEGLSFEAREQIRRLGSNNVILRSVKPAEETGTRANTARVIEYGLTYADIERIATTVPRAEVVVPTRELPRDIWFHGRRVDGKVVGTVPWYPQITGRRVVSGRFVSSGDMHDAANVCVVSTGLMQKMGGLYNPLGDVIKVGTDYYKVVGVMESMGTSSEGTSSGLADTGREVYIPLTTARMRFGEVISTRSAGSQSMERVELHGAIVRVAESDDVLQTSEVIEAQLKRFHEKQDYEMIVPLQLLREKERVKRIYNLVLGLMAAISLLVGGIGIMNIMLASVSERTPEIGIRRAIGAKKRDIMAQFLTETVLLSGCGGLAGVALGVAMPQIISRLSGMTTLVTIWSVLLAFGISALVGIIFGFYPAIRAANMDPIVALRHE